MKCCQWIGLITKPFLFFTLLLGSHSLLADHSPDHSTFEWGIGLVALDMPDYRGSAHSQNQILPFPYIKYRSDRLRIDDGIEGRLFETPDLLLSISGNGALTSSDDNPEREGMNTLDATVEIGPSLEYRLLQNEFTSLWFELPLRLGISVGSDISHIGNVTHPRVAWRKPALNKNDWKLRIATGPLYADESYHGYFYNVKPTEANVLRPEYTAKSGYSGVRTDFTFSKRIKNFWLGGFVRFDSLDGSIIDDSPLVTETESWMAGISIAWVIGEK